MFASRIPTNVPQQNVPAVPVVVAQVQPTLYTYTNPNLLAAAKLGKTLDHNMVAYWDCCGKEPNKLKTKVEPDKTYTPR